MFKIKRLVKRNVMTPVELEKQIKNKLEIEKKKNENLIPYFSNFFLRLFSSYEDYFKLAEKYMTDDCNSLYIHIGETYTLNLIIELHKIENNKIEYTATFIDSLSSSIERINRIKNVERKDIKVSATYIKDDGKIHLHNECILNNDEQAITVWRNIRDKLIKIDEDEFWNNIVNELSYSILNNVKYKGNN